MRDKRPRRIRRGGRGPLAVAALLSAVLVVAACGSGSEAGNTPSGGQSTPQTSSEQTQPSSPASETPPTASSDAGSGTASSTTGGATPADLVPAAIRDKGKIVVAFDASTPPGEFVDTDGKTIIGQQPDIVAAVMKVLDLDYEAVNAPFDNILPGLVDGKYDIGQAGMFATTEREKQVDMVSYAWDGTAFYVPADSNAVFNSPEDLCGVDLAVQIGSAQDNDAKEQSAKCVAEGKKPVNVLTFNSGSDEQLAVQSKRAQVGWDTASTVTYLAKTTNSAVKISGDIMRAPSPKCTAFPKGNGMAAAFAAGIDQIIADGTYDKIQEKWAMENTKIDSATVNPVESGLIPG